MMTDHIEALARKMCNEDAAYDDGVAPIADYHPDWDNSDTARRKYWLDRAAAAAMRWRTRDNVSMLGT
jgi:hypothetical protein